MGRAPRLRYGHVDQAPVIMRDVPLVSLLVPIPLAQQASPMRR